MASDNAVIVAVIVAIAAAGIGLVSRLGSAAPSASPSTSSTRDRVFGIIASGGRFSGDSSSGNGGNDPSEPGNAGGGSTSYPDVYEVTTGDGDVLDPEDEAGGSIDQAFRDTQLEQALTGAANLQRDDSGVDPTDPLDVATGGTDDLDVDTSPGFGL